ncbi:hypothetical protein MPSEU_000239200 [Mayamaea pseudoterrestris]|nr:hypothetical protein MPSEU_000239200 [Mayamaea pseudoterrestris]
MPHQPFKPRAGVLADSQTVARIRRQKVEVAGHHAKRDDPAAAKGKVLFQVFGKEAEDLYSNDIYIKNKPSAKGLRRYLKSLTPAQLEYIEELKAVEAAKALAAPSPVAEEDDEDKEDYFVEDQGAGGATNFPSDADADIFSRQLDFGERTGTPISHVVKAPKSDPENMFPMTKVELQSLERALVAEANGSDGQGFGTAAPRGLPLEAASQAGPNHALPRVRPVHVIQRLLFGRIVLEWSIRVFNCLVWTVRTITEWLFNYGRGQPVRMIDPHGQLNGVHGPHVQHFGVAAQHGQPGGMVGLHDSAFGLHAPHVPQFGKTAQVGKPGGVVDAYGPTLVQQLRTAGNAGPTNSLVSHHTANANAQDAFKLAAENVALPAQQGSASAVQPGEPPRAPDLQADAHQVAVQFPAGNKLHRDINGFVLNKDGKTYCQGCKVYPPFFEIQLCGKHARNAPTPFIPLWQPAPEHLQRDWYLCKGGNVYCKKCTIVPAEDPDDWTIKFCRPSHDTSGA